MRLAGTESWQVSMDIPAPMEFAAYIGQQEGFSLEGHVSSPPEEEWRQWLEVLLTEEPSPMGRPPIDPPEFALLAEKPHFRELCQRHWSGFTQHWNQTKPKLVKQLLAQTNALHLQDIIKNYERNAKRRARPFKLRVDFIEWPEEYRRVISENQVVLDTSYLENIRLNDLRAVLELQIAPLV